MSLNWSLAVSVCWNASSVARVSCFFHSNPTVFIDVWIFCSLYLTSLCSELTTRSPNKSMQSRRMGYVIFVVQTQIVDVPCFHASWNIKPAIVADLFSPWTIFARIFYLFYWPILYIGWKFTAGNSCLMRILRKTIRCLNGTVMCVTSDVSEVYYESFRLVY